MRSFDAVVVGGGPAGSACAGRLRRAGLSVAVLDRAAFPRVKLCAGWLSAPIWDLLETSAKSYPGGLWPWRRCHVHLGKKRYVSKTRGYFIRRYEFDHWLLSMSGAKVYQHAVREIVRDEDSWCLDGRYRTRILVGAGGTHCPVARSLFPPRRARPVAAQELEFAAPPAEIAATRLGEDGEPELILHEDLAGYSWNIPKSGWLNVGTGTVDPKRVKDAWAQAQRFYLQRGHLPVRAQDSLKHARGHSYYLYQPENLERCAAEGAYLVGDALGVAQPLTAEGIVPAILSGRLCALSILDENGPTYRERMHGNPVFSDYAFLYALRERAAAMRSVSHSGSAAGSRLLAPLRDSALASGFAWMFAGRALPGRRIRRLLQRGSR